MNEVLNFVRQRLAEKNWDPYVEPPGKGLLLGESLERFNRLGDSFL